eukprot:5809048-Alexandrium_andersonii.AAC.1
MSASLVGSEMCIRDRSSGEFRRAPESSEELWRALESCALRRAPASSEEPVSYTHLTLPTICSV